MTRRISLPVGDKSLDFVFVEGAHGKPYLFGDHLTTPWVGRPRPVHSSTTHFR
jgi:hypothetical protein